MFSEALVDPLYFLIAALHVLVAPFTKVEESFTLHSIHDIIHHGIRHLDKFDHIEFPGAVPRSFIPALVIGNLAKVLELIVPINSKLHLLFLVRGIVALINWVSLVYLRQALKTNIFAEDSKQLKQESIKEKLKKAATPLKSKNGKVKAKPTQQSKSSDKVNHKSLVFWFGFITFTQFHFMFYSSRTLPNFIALPLSNIAFAKIFQGDYITAILILSFTSVVLRIELAALTLSLGFICLLYKRITILQLVKAGLIGGIAGVLISGSIDSYFWKRFTVPELESFIFNVIDGKSAEWGVSPWYEYFARTALKLFLIPYVPILALIGFFNDPTSNQSLKIALLSSLGFVSIMSFQGHKEWRFIAYIIPLINITAATQASTFTSKAFKTRWNWYKLITIGIFGCSALSFLFATFWLQVSYFNYPGGQPLITAQQSLVRSMQEEGVLPQHYGTPGHPITIHADTYVCVNGASLFSDVTDQLPEIIDAKIDKTEDPEKLAQLWDEFDFLVTETSNVAELPIAPGFKWEEIRSFKAYVGIDPFAADLDAMITKVLMKKSIIPVYLEVQNLIRLEDKVFIYKKTPIASDDQYD